MTHLYKDKQKIIDWLNKYKVKGYTLVPDEKYGFVVNVIGDVHLYSRDLEFIQVKFGEVVGNFFCSFNKLNSLDFSPEFVVGGFFCNNNELTSLKNCPKTVNGTFDCSCNNLISLDYCPRYVSGVFYCDNNIELEEVQNIKTFKEIYSIHKELVVDNFAGKLDTSLSDIEEHKKQNKIKL